MRGSEDEQFGMDSIRAMKGCFLVSELGRDSWNLGFDFRPYAYGPFDVRVYQYRDELLREGFLELADAEAPYEQCVLTDAGESRARAFASHLGEDAEWVEGIGKWVSSQTFSDLLREVYARFPDYAAESVARI